MLVLEDSMNTPHFFVRPDGTFRAFMGDIILKSEKIGDTEGYHFSGIASTPDKDREDETLLQKGLNFEPFKQYGEFNWNHIPYAMVGMPIGKQAWFEDGCWHSEGVILKGMPIHGDYDTDFVVKQHNQLKKAGIPRGLCQSVEGKVTERSKCKKFVKSADIYNIALTFRPINPKCSINMLAKSMDGRLPLAVVDGDFYKSLTSSQTGSFTKEDLEGSGENSFEKRLVRHLIKKGYKASEAQSHVTRYLKFSGR